jgi:hypothetical protein
MLKNKKLYFVLFKLQKGGLRMKVSLPLDEIGSICNFLS